MLSGMPLKLSKSVRAAGPLQVINTARLLNQIATCKDKRASAVLCVWGDIGLLSISSSGRPLLVTENCTIHEHTCNSDWLADCRCKAFVCVGVWGCGLEARHRLLKHFSASNGGTSATWES
jgi:hypothetical protein